MISGRLFASFAVNASAQAPEKIAEIRVHGNHTTPDADVLRLSGLEPGGEPSEARLKAAEQKLKSTHRFEGVELRKRYLSITDPSQVLVMIVVDEHPAVSASDLTPGPLKKFRAMQMWMPILKHEDGYGFTYGARLAYKDSLGDRSRVSVPMTWGGERRIGLEAERSFDGPISIVRGGVSLYRRINPFYEVPDRRSEARVEADKLLTSWLRAGVDASVAQVTFAVTVLTGVLRAAEQLQDVNDLWTTAYGEVLALKLFGMLAMLAVSLAWRRGSPLARADAALTIRPARSRAFSSRRCACLQPRCDCSSPSALPPYR